MTKDETLKFHAELLFKKFGKLTLNTKELARVIDRSEVSLQRDRAAKIGIPYSQFQTKGKKGDGRNICHYAVSDIAKYLLDNQLKVAGA